MLPARRESPSAPVRELSFPVLISTIGNANTDVFAFPGQRPKCSLCELKDTECVYDTRAGEARGAHLKRKVTELTQEITYLKQCVETLRTSPWNEAMDLLHRIQTTPHLDDALKLITDSSILLSVRNRSGNDSSPGQADGHSESPSPTPEMPKKKRLRTEESASSTSSQAPRDPRMSIEQLTCIAAEASPPKRSLPYPPVHHVMDGVLPRIELRNWGSVTSEETDP